MNLKEIINIKNNFSNLEIYSLIGQGNSANIYAVNFNGSMVALKVIDKTYIYHNEMMDKIQLEKNILSSFNEEKYLSHMRFFL